MIRWRVRLAGDDGRLKELARVMRNTDLSIVDDDGLYYLRASAFDSMADINEVHAFAKEQLPRINNVAAFRWGDMRPVEIDAVEQTDEGGRRHHFKRYAGAPLVVGARVQVQGITINASGIQGPPPPDDFEAWFDLAQSDERVDRAFHLFGLAHDFPTLYNVLDVVQKDVGGERALRDKEWVSGACLKTFKQTANNDQALEGRARHGAMGWASPKNRMTYSDARLLMRTLLTSWLREKRQSMDV